MNEVKKETRPEKDRAGKQLTACESIALGLHKFGIPKSVLVDDSQSFRKIEKKRE